MQKNKELFKERRRRLLESVKKNNPQVSKGALLFIAGFEDERTPFRQESSFYYLTGLQEPGVVLFIDLDGREKLLIPQYDGKRAQWVATDIQVDKKSADQCGIDAVEYLGKSVSGYVMPLLAGRDAYEYLCSLLGDYVKNDAKIFACYQPNARHYVQQNVIFQRLTQWVVGLEQSFINCAAFIASLRRTKSKMEIEQLYKAIELTMIAQQGAACAIQEGKKEYEIQAGIEYIFKEAGAHIAFPSIVATGYNSTILHYTPSSRVMKNGELVVVDIGAEVNYYCADITRTYPVSGNFSKRQREVYRVVLDTQEYIAQVAAPGYWLNNKEYPEKSLHHLAIKFLEKKGYANYFCHGIGHFLGMDVHDVGDYSEPLQEGDVFTIEPGVYLPAEGFGIRIEDDYWIVKDGAICLSQDLPKEPDIIEEMVQLDLADSEENEELDPYDDDTSH